MFQTLTDKMAISLSLLCAIHCLAFPFMVVVLPSLAALQLDEEVFHFWMLSAVIPTSTYALTMGCKQHKNYSVFMLGLLGLFVLVFSAIVVKSLLGELWEKIMTSLGAGIIAYSHYRNYRLCQDQGNCVCPGRCEE